MNEPKPKVPLSSLMHKLPSHEDVFKQKLAGEARVQLVSLSPTSFA